MLGYSSDLLNVELIALRSFQALSGSTLEWGHDTTLQGQYIDHLFFTSSTLSQIDLILT